LPRTGQRLLVIADTAAGTAGLGERHSWPDRGYQQNTEEGDSCPASKSALHVHLVSDDWVEI
jgi:hypothetical protein